MIILMGSISSVAVGIVAILAVHTREMKTLRKIINDNNNTT